MFASIQKRVVSLLQLLLVIIYIIFEELIWEGIAKPVYRMVHALKILHKIEMKLHEVSGAVILVFFTVLLGMVEALGIYAGVLFVSGEVMLGILLYISKIPIAAFTFWVFRITEDKLMEFRWFAWLYHKLMQAIEWVKARDIYHSTIDRLYDIKMRIKTTTAKVKEKYFATESPFMLKIKEIYKTIKATLKK